MYRLKTPGRYIVIEAIDGAGSTTLKDGLVAELRSRGISTVGTKEPQDESISWTGSNIRQILRGQKTVHERTKQMYFAADRSEHMQNVVLPALEGGAWVVSDRSFISSIAFGVGQGLEMQEIMDYNQKFPWPDLAIFIRIPVEVTQERLKKRSDQEIHDSISVQAAVAAVYDQLAEDLPQKPLILDGRLPPPDLVRVAADEASKLCGERKTAR